MRLTPKDQLGTIMSALTTGAAEYRLHAANQRAQENMDGVIFATSRANFLVALYHHLDTYAKAESIDDPLFAWTVTSDYLQELADEVSAKLHETLRYDATRPGEAQIAVARQERSDQALIDGTAPKPLTIPMDGATLIQGKDETAADFIKRVAQHLTRKEDQ